MEGGSRDITEPLFEVSLVTRQRELERQGRGLQRSIGEKWKALTTLEYDQNLIEDEYISTSYETL
jgi:hypothetical protein